jgi:hypothetical protein
MEPSSDSSPGLLVGLSKTVCWVCEHAPEGFLALNWDGIESRTETLA